jgi:hypothetical protein
MGKSLTEVAKAVLMNESNDSAPDRDAKKTNPNLATLRPGSKYKEEPFSNPGATAPKDGAKLVAVAPKAPGEGDNFGAAASSEIKEDKSKPKQGARPAEPMKKYSERLQEAKRRAKKEEEEELEEAMKMVKSRKKEEEEELEEAMKMVKSRKKEEEEELEEAKAHKRKEEEEEELEEQLEAFIEGMMVEGYSDDQIIAAIEENFEFVTEEDVAASYEVDMQEAMDALFAGEELSEDFKAKAATIFEAAVKAKLAEEVVVLEEAYAATLEEEVNTIEESLSSNVDDYLNYVVEQWASENEIAIEAGLRSELTEDFISGLRSLFAEHYIDIPEDKVSVVEEMGKEIFSLKNKLNEEIDHNVALNKMLSESTANEVLANACEGLTDTQTEKLKTLAEGIEYANVNEYAQKLSVLRENYFTTSVKSGKVLDSAETVSDGRGMISEELTGPMAAYVKTLGKTLPN